MDTVLQQLINGLSLGAIYALIALGYTMVYGVLRLINFAHGDVYMLGAFAGYFLANALNLDVQSGDTGTRILKPLRSSGPLIGLVDDVVWRKPLSQIFSITTRFALAISPRI